MEFPDYYFEDEVREGFYVPSLMKRAWAAQMEVLKCVEQVCEKYHIRYFAEWGTLLGAVRHGGRIPWDDDIDICMLREDYDKFCEVAGKELPEEYSFWDHRSTDNFDYLVGRVINSKVHVVNGKLLEKYHGYPYVAGIDIFWLDSLPSDQKAEEEYFQVHQYTDRLIGWIKQSERGNVVIKPEELEYHIKKVEKLCDVHLDRKKSIRKQLYQIQEQVGKSACHKYGSNEVTNLYIWMNNRNYRLPRKCYETIVWMPFENTELPLPVGYDELLSRKYGNEWMEPIRSGGAHDYPSYKKQQEFLEQENGAELYEFKYSKEEVEETDKARPLKESLRKRVQDFIPLFCEAHEEIQQHSTNQEYDVVLQVLADCQDAAIQIGSMIEQEEGEGHSTVKLLEQYCETIFHLHTELSQGSLLELDALSEFEKSLADSIDRDIIEKKVAVFVPYKASLWCAMESVWRAAMEDEETEVYVIPTPYYYKDVYGKAKTEEPHYETEGYPEEVVLTGYEDFDFQARRPDIVVIQCPYDEYNYGMTVHPFFYSKNLKKYTDKLVYIPAFVMDEIGLGDDRAKETLKSYCNMPGVVYADTVIVQSEQMKDVYVELLTEFAGEDTRLIWENKIRGLGSPVYDQKPLAKEDMEVPEEWLPVLQKTDGTWKKVILYSTSASALIRYGQTMIDKMRDVFRIFRENQDEIALLWRPDDYVQDVGESMDPKSLQKYNELVRKYWQEGWGIYDDSPDAERAVQLCDACYGDRGVVQNACRRQGKTVMMECDSFAGICERLKEREQKKEQEKVGEKIYKAISPDTP